MEDNKNELERSKLNLLNKFNKGFIKFREIEKKVDLFLPSQDLFIFLNENESVFFNKIFVNKEGVNPNNKEEVNFILDLYNEQKRYPLL